MTSVDWYISQSFIKVSFSGRGNTTKMQERDPFHFAIHVSLRLLLVSSGPSSRPIASSDLFRPSEIWQHDWCLHRAPDGNCVNYIPNSAAPSATATTGTTTMTSVDWYISQSFIKVSFSGRGNTTKMHERDPFHFAIHVSLRLLLVSSGPSSRPIASSDLFRPSEIWQHDWCLHRAPDGNCVNYIPNSAAPSATATSWTTTVRLLLVSGPSSRPIASSDLFRPSEIWQHDWCLHRAPDGNCVNYIPNSAAPSATATSGTTTVRLLLVSSGPSSRLIDSSDLFRPSEIWQHDWCLHRAPDGNCVNYIPNSAAPSATATSWTTTVRLLLVSSGPSSRLIASSDLFRPSEIWQHDWCLHRAPDGNCVNYIPTAPHISNGNIRTTTVRLLLVSSGPSSRHIASSDLFRPPEIWEHGLVSSSSSRRFDLDCCWYHQDPLQGLSLARMCSGRLKSGNVTSVFIELQTVTCVNYIPNSAAPSATATSGTTTVRLLLVSSGPSSRLIASSDLFRPSEIWQHDWCLHRAPDGNCVNYIPNSSAPSATATSWTTTVRLLLVSSGPSSRLIASSDLFRPSEIWQHDWCLHRAPDGNCVNYIPNSAAPSATATSGTTTVRLLLVSSGPSSRLIASSDLFRPSEIWQHDWCLHRAPDGNCVNYIPNSATTTVRLLLVSSGPSSRHIASSDLFRPPEIGNMDSVFIELQTCLHRAPDGNCVNYIPNSAAPSATATSGTTTVRLLLVSSGPSSRLIASSDLFRPSEIWQHDWCLHRAPDGNCVNYIPNSSAPSATATSWTTTVRLLLVSSGPSSRLIASSDLFRPSEIWQHDWCLHRAPDGNCVNYIPNSATTTVRLLLVSSGPSSRHIASSDLFRPPEIGNMDSVFIELQTCLHRAPDGNCVNYIPNSAAPSATATSGTTTVRLLLVSSGPSSRLIASSDLFRPSEIWQHDWCLHRAPDGNCVNYIPNSSAPSATATSWTTTVRFHLDCCWYHQDPLQGLSLARTCSGRLKSGNVTSVFIELQTVTAVNYIPESAAPSATATSGTMTVTSVDWYIRQIFSKETFSGRGSTTKMQEIYPFLFVIQVSLRLLLVSSGPCSRPIASSDLFRPPEIWEHDYCLHRAPDDCCSYHQDPLQGLSLPRIFSGRLKSGNMTTVFIELQTVSLRLLLVLSGPSSRPIACSDLFRPPEIWEHDYCLHRAPDGDCVNYIPKSAAPSATATSGTTTVTSVDWYISQSFSKESFSGRCSTTKIQERYPFLFVIQVSLRLLLVSSGPSSRLIASSDLFRPPEIWEHDYCLHRAPDGQSSRPIASSDLFRPPKIWEHDWCLHRAPDGNCLNYIPNSAAPSATATSWTTTVRLLLVSSGPSSRPIASSDLFRPHEIWEHDYCLHRAPDATATSGTTNVTSVDWYITQSFSNESFSVRGSTTKIQERYPFLLVIQVSLRLLLVSSGPSSRPIASSDLFRPPEIWEHDYCLHRAPDGPSSRPIACSDLFRPPEIWEHDYCLHRAPDGDCVNYIPKSAAPSATATSGTTTVTSVDWYISQSFSKESFSGRCSNTKIQERYPFLFVIQVSLRLLLVSSGPSSRLIASSDLFRPPEIWEHDYCLHRAPDGECVNYIPNSAALSATATSGTTTVRLLLVSSGPSSRLIASSDLFRPPEIWEHDYCLHRAPDGECVNYIPNSAALSATATSGTTTVRLLLVSSGPSSRLIASSDLFRPHEIWEHDWCLHRAPDGNSVNCIPNSAAPSATATSGTTTVRLLLVSSGPSSRPIASSDLFRPSEIWQHDWCLHRAPDDCCWYHQDPLQGLSLPRICSDRMKSGNMTSVFIELQTVTASTTYPTAPHHQQRNIRDNDREDPLQGLSLPRICSGRLKSGNMTGVFIELQTVTASTTYPTAPHHQQRQHQGRRPCAPDGNCVNYIPNSAAPSATATSGTTTVRLLLVSSGPSSRLIASSDLFRPHEIWQHDWCLHRAPDDGNCVNYIPNSAAPSATATSRTTTVTSVDWYISQSVRKESFSGRGSTTKMQERGPFLFVIQVSLRLLLVSSGPSSRPIASSDVFRPPKIWEHDLRLHRAPDGDCVNYIPNSATPSATAASGTTTVTSVGRHISQSFIKESFSGRGNTTRMQERDPVLFVIHVSLRLLLVSSGPPSRPIASSDLFRPPEIWEHDYCLHRAPDGDCVNYIPNSAAPSATATSGTTNVTSVD
ncbi:hypothetical protein V5799_023093 [Amblyomma americanum]|uniref:Uncharacterized protein n=1 Tax=Amblyomma americanum TaxID=6943 RepID=A0AAQ4FKA8_AMBAM